MKQRRTRRSRASIWRVAALCACVAGCGADGDDDAAAGSGGAAANTAGSSGKAAGASGSGGVAAGSGGNGAAVGMSSGGRGGGLGSGGAGGSMASGTGGMTSGGSGGAGAGAAGSGGAGAGSGGAGDHDAGLGPRGSSDILAPDNGALLGIVLRRRQHRSDHAEARPQRCRFTSRTTRGATTGPANGTKADLAAGRIPLVNWEPYDAEARRHHRRHVRHDAAQAGGEREGA